MSGEQQYINPIIDTMLRTHQQQQASEELKARTAQYAAENKLREQQLAQQESEFERNHQLALDTLEKFHLPQMQAVLEGHRLAAKKAMYDAAAQGVGPSGLASLVGGSVQPPVNLVPPNLSTPGGVPMSGPQGVSVPGSITLPNGGGSISLGDLPTPQSEAARVQGLAKAQSGGAAEGQFPFQAQLAQFGFDKEKYLKQMDESFQSKKQKEDLASRERVAGLERNTQYSIANLHNATQLKLAGFGISPDEYNSNVKPIVMGLASGEISPNLSNPIQRMAYDTLSSQGWRPLEKKEGDELKQLNVLSPLFDKLENFANKYLPDSSLRAGVQGYITKHSPIPTDVQNQMAQINSQALNAGRAIEGFSGGRVLSKQLELDLNSLTSPGITKDQALSRLQNLKDMYVNKEKNVIMGGMPPEQVDYVTKRLGIQQPSSAGQAKPDWLKIAPAKNKNGKSLDEETSIQVGHPVYK